MGREPRIEYEGAIYHVIQRGNNRESIFARDGYKKYLLKKLNEYKQKAGCRLIGYVIMDNHYHFILQTFDQPLQKVMHLVNNSYSKFYNTVRKRSGHVFEGRYRAIVVQEERYAFTLLRYVHLNPVRANVCKYVWQYNWSSDMYYRKNINGLVDIDLILDTFSDKRPEAIRQYAKLMGQTKENGVFESNDLMGDQFFLLTKDERDSINHGKILDKILLATGVNKEDYYLIKKGSRKRFLTPYKVIYARKALEHNYSLEQIAENIKLSRSGLCRLLKE